MSGVKQTVIVAYRDRIGRFGFDVFQWIIERNAGKLLVLVRTKHAPKSKRTSNLLAILHVFSCRLPGIRSYKAKINPPLSDKESKENV
jgi:predicted site-specific integrase-resolvase